jgi:Cu+-exporting ATPase
LAVDPATSKHQVEYSGTIYHFCSAGGQAKFTADPDFYLKPKAQTPAAPAVAGIIYTCPMHPQIRERHAGSCPLCGMALEPLSPTAA